MNDYPANFSATHHALLFAWISKAIIDQAGEEKGEVLIRRAVRQYGQERGHRMAQRARADEQDLSLTTFLSYGEWKAGPGEMEVQKVERPPDIQSRVFKCPWHSAWRETGLLPFGRFYCLEIDEALAEGFNPKVNLEVRATQTNGARECEFVYHQATLEGANHPPAGEPKGVDPNQNVRPWEYHAGHLFVTLEKMVIAELGEPGRAAVEAGLAEFSRYYGEAAAQIVTSFRAVDFSQP